MSPLCTGAHASNGRTVEGARNGACGGVGLGEEGEVGTSDALPAEGPSSLAFWGLREEVGYRGKSWGRVGSATRECVVKRSRRSQVSCGSAWRVYSIGHLDSRRYLDFVLHHGRNISVRVITYFL